MYQDFKLITLFLFLSFYSNAQSDTVFVRSFNQISEDGLYSVNFFKLDSTMSENIGIIENKLKKGVWINRLYYKGKLIGVKNTFFNYLGLPTKMVELDEKGMILQEEFVKYNNDSMFFTLFKHVYDPVDYRLKSISTYLIFKNTGCFEASWDFWNSESCDRRVIQHISYNYYFKKNKGIVLTRTKTYKEHLLIGEYTECHLKINNKYRLIFIEANKVKTHFMREKRVRKIIEKYGAPVLFLK